MKIGYDDILKSIRYSDYENIKNYGIIIEKGIVVEWNKFYSDNKDYDSVVDEKAEEIQLLKYRMMAMQMCCLIEVWEQDLFNYLYDIGQKESNTELIQVLTYSRSTKSYLDNRYETIEKGYQILYNVSMTNISNMKYLRRIVNAIKHGSGRDFEKIKEEIGEGILADSNFGRINEDGFIERFKQVKYDNNTLTSIVLNLEGKVEESYNAIIKFWDETYKLEKNRRDANV